MPLTVALSFCLVIVLSRKPLPLSKHTQSPLRQSTDPEQVDASVGILLVPGFMHLAESTKLKNVATDPLNSQHFQTS
jgi:hypothetical protein